MANFNLGERDLTIVVKELLTVNPENTTFIVNNTMYRGIYYIKDFLTVNKDLDIKFSNLHCDFNIKGKIDPNLYTKLITINYGYDSTGTCKVFISPSEYNNIFQQSIVQKTEIMNTISLNDLGILDYINIFIFGVFVSIFLLIKLVIEKSKILIYNK